MDWHIILDTLARFCIVYTFFKSGIVNSQHAEPVIGMITSKKWPYPKVIYAATVILLFIAPIMIVGHYFDRIAALALLVFTLLSNIFFCNYWTMDKKSRPMTEFLFDANIAIMGGLILIMVSSI